MPDVHPRPRKRPPRCTLDCGFKTSESPALRGFVAERCPIRGTSLYLVLLSNGLHHSENLPVKFGFSPQIVPANIVKKLSPQCCSKPLLIPFFNFSHKGPTFAFTPESGYTLGFRRKIAHSGSHGEIGRFPPPATAWSCAASEILFIPPRFYIHTFPGSLWPLTIGRREKVSEDATATLSPTIPHCVFQLRSQMAHVRFHRRKRIHTRLSEKDRTQRLTRRNRWRFGWGWYHYPRSALRAAETLDGRLSKGLICRFLRLPSSTPCAVTFSANMQISLSAISVANTFALWYDKSYKSGLFGDEGEPE